MSKMGFLKSNLCAAPKSMVFELFNLVSKKQLWPETEGNI